MKVYTLDRKRTANGYLLTGKVWVSDRKDGGWHITPVAGETLKVYRPGMKKPVTVKSSSPVVMWIDEQQNLRSQEQIPVPALTKSEGMVLAYTFETPEREVFEALLYEFCLSAPAVLVFSSNDIWDQWRSRGWADPPKRAFVGPTMQHGEKAGWMEYVRMVENTMTHSHSSEMNRGYRSLIGDEWSK